MITSFFKTTKPFHFVLVTLFSFFIFCYYRKDLILEDFSFASVVQNFTIYLVLIFSIAIQVFLVTKNNLTQKSSFNIVFLVLFLGIIPSTLIDNNIVIANLFVVLALRRLVSLKSNIAVKKKLFDAAFWIGIASLFYFWAILFFVLIVFAMLLYAIGHIKNWVIPFTALIVLVICVTAYSILISNTFFEIESYISTVSFDLSNYNKITLVIGITVIITIIIWVMFYYIKKIQDLVRTKRTSYVLILYALFIALTIVIISPEKSGAEFIFVFTPLAIISTNYLEIIEDSWFAELFMWLLVVTVMVILVLQFYAIG